MATTKQLKAIIVGGGPVGLTAAHALKRAGINFVLLESQPTCVLEAGSNSVLLPSGMRTLGQLGPMNQVRLRSSALDHVTRIDHQGQSIGDVTTFKHLKQQ